MIKSSRKVKKKNHKGVVTSLQPGEKYPTIIVSSKGAVDYLKRWNTLAVDLKNEYDILPVDCKVKIVDEDLTCIEAWVTNITAVTKFITPDYSYKYDMRCLHNYTIVVKCMVNPRRLAIEATLKKAKAL